MVFILDFYWKKKTRKKLFFIKQQKGYDKDHILGLFILCLATRWFYASSYALLIGERRTR